MKKLFFYYGEEVTTCILIKSNGIVLSRGVAIKDGDTPYSKEMGEEIAYKRARRALKKHNCFGTKIKNKEAIERINRVEAKENFYGLPTKSLDIQKKYDFYNLYEFFTEKENEFLLNYFNPRKESEITQ